jgi:dienelactone hydrolase
MLMMIAATDGPIDWNARGRAVVDELSAQAWPKVTARYDETMARLMPADKLAEVWKTLLGQVGALRHIDSSTTEEDRGYHRVLVPCEFERGKLIAKVVFDGRGRLAGLFFAPWQAPSPWSQPPYARTEAFTERTIKVGPAALPGTLTFPRGADRHPVIVLVHGSGPHDQDETIGPNKTFKDLAWGLASRGVAVVRYEKRTHKAPESFRSQYTVSEEVTEDAVAAVALAAQAPEVDNKRIFVLGHSLGGMLAPRIAAATPQVAGIILLAGTPRPLEELVLEQFRRVGANAQQMEQAEATARAIRDPQLRAGQMVSFLGAPTPASYWLDLRRYDAAKTAAGLKIPIFVLQGGRDYQVTRTDFGAWKRALAGRKNVELKLYPALNHLFVEGTGESRPAEYEQPGHVAEQVITDLAGWVTSR